MTTKIIIDAGGDNPAEAAAAAMRVLACIVASYSDDVPQQHFHVGGTNGTAIAEVVTIPEP